jgi:hypothetical protein
MLLVSGAFVSAAFAQPQAPPPGAPLPNPQAPPPNAAMAAPPAYPAAELERIVSPIALYPDPLLAQVLAAATFSADIPDAAGWADQHHYLTGAALTAAMAADRLPWDPSVQALLPFPSVLGTMASNMPWTEELGAAFLSQQPEVMEAVQRMRQRAQSYGYLRSNPGMVVRGGPYIEIVPANPAFIVVPYYDPIVVFAPPRRGIFVGNAIGVGFGVRIGPAFAPWGWGGTRFGWSEHVVIVNNAPWRRAWTNRAVNVHPYAVPRYPVERRAIEQRRVGDERRAVEQQRAVEQHRAIERSAAERNAERTGHARREEHKPAAAHRPADEHKRPDEHKQPEEPKG